MRDATRQLNLIFNRRMNCRWIERRWGKQFSLKVKWSYKNILIKINFVRFLPGRISSTSVAGVKIFCKSIGCFPSNLASYKLNKINDRLPTSIELINSFSPDFLAQVNEKRFLGGIESIGGFKAAFRNNFWINWRCRFRPLQCTLEALFTVAIILAHWIHVF